MRRILYLFRNLGGPLEGKLEEGVHWSTSGNVIYAHKDTLGRELNSQMTVLPEGATQWRFEALTLGVLDEFTYNKQGLKAYGAALGCIEGGEGKLAIIFTGAFGSFANKETLMMLSRATRVEGDLGRYIHQTADP